MSQISLPGGIGTSIFGIGLFYPDGSPTQRIGIVPDIEVVQDFAAIQAGRDAQLDKALGIFGEFIRSLFSDLSREFSLIRNV